MTAELDNKGCKYSEDQQFNMWFCRYVNAFNGTVAQLVRAPPCHGGGRRFDPVPGRFFFNLIKNTVGVLAQLGEHLPYKQRVTGSSPVGPIVTNVLCRCGSIGRAADL